MKRLLLSFINIIATKNKVVYYSNHDAEKKEIANNFKKIVINEIDLEMRSQVPDSKSILMQSPESDIFHNEYLFREFFDISMNIKQNSRQTESIFLWISIPEASRRLRQIAGSIKDGKDYESVTLKRKNKNSENNIEYRTKIKGNSLRNEILRIDEFFTSAIKRKKDIQILVE
ncbi:MAG: hypothetical protein N4A72_22420 [Bacteroidales bacterium]|jgi:hypothetical protein|nr:hypothetical protein [Bacteroidales bacterium]